MKRLLILGALFVLMNPVNVLAVSSYSDSTVTYNYTPTSSDQYDPSGAQVSTSQSIGSNAIARASASASAETAGVQAYAAPGYGARATANWDNLWTATGSPGNTIIDCSAFPCNYSFNATFHLDGVLDPVVVSGTSVSLSTYLNFNASYYFGGGNSSNGINTLWISGGYDGGPSSGGVGAFLDYNGNYYDLSSYITYGTANSGGDIPFSFDYTISGLSFIGSSTFGESMGMVAEVDNSDSVSHNIDAFHTFKTSYESLDPNVTWTSASGQTMPGPASTSVPEPSTMLLLGCGVFSLIAFRKNVVAE